MSRLDFSKSTAWIALIVTVMIVGSIVIFVSRESADVTVPAELVEAPRPGHLAPEFTLTTTTGETVSLSDYRGQVVVLNFWATWCGPCRFEMPDLQRLSEEMDGKAVVLGVNQGQDSAEITRFATSVGVDYPLLLDEDSVTNRLYRVVALPTTYFIDGDGVIREQLAGTATQAVLQAKAERLLE
ncbi:MAG: TlpA family protein disulfide reductase [Anaerolineae bacterium]|nr:TlpA family protein disulfide reductase [Anaerolineae bacterium]MCO5195398.1 TlpA family protein disulfide reductase [Anaerolineae bacterium]